MGTAKKGKQGNSDELLEELGRELRHLRALVREVGESFILRREGEIEALIGHLATLPPARLRAEAEGWLRGIHGLKTKPEKGRLKDLKGIDRLLDDLAERVATAQEGRTGPGGGG